ncbi:MAG: hypothetical protein A2219_04825 [Elusimicrobia bacterium RIFOXYA2_FULL_50_26]|nr:MAG: hypothetical protein A2219_04825 [Elusimicrobia bacterium RIFOXYA2_FULL_50_26]OGS24498.1 MAG: hypothetical protein A2314_04585 [Elusimicrobia bacterium RIFOXYB2_FULL_50_12]
MKIKSLLERLFIDSEFKQEIQFLKKIPLFSALSDREAGEVLTIANRKHYSQGEIVFNEGDAGKVFYCILSGAIKGTRQGKEQFRIQAGGYFGEMALIAEIKRSVTVEAAADTELLLIYKVKFDGFLQDNPSAGVKVLHHIAEEYIYRLREKDEHGI